MIEMEKLVGSKEYFPSRDRGKFINAHLVFVNPMLEVALPSHATLFKEPFFMLISMYSSILGYKDGLEDDEAMLELLTIIFPMDDKPLVMFHFADFLVVSII